MAQEELLISLKIEGEENDKKINALTSSITSLTKANQDLIQQNKNLTKSGQDNSKQYQENAKQIEINKQKITENTASRKGLVQAIIAEDNSIKGLTIQNANLIKQRNLINDSTKEGRAEIDRINSKLDENNERIRQNSSALEKQKINIGNYASALDGIIPGFGAFANGIQTATKAGLTFIATPLGATLAAIGLALLPIIKYLRDTGEGQDLLAEKTAEVNAVLDFFNQNLIQIGKALLGFPSDVEDNGLVKFFKIIVDNTPNIVTFSRAMYNLIPEKTRQDLEETAKQASALARALDDIADAEEDYGIEAEKTANEVKRLAIESRNRTLSEEERIAKIDEALGLEATLAVKRKQFAQDEFSALVKGNEARLTKLGIIQKEDETQEQFVTNNLARIRNEVGDNEELVKKFIAGLIKIEEAEGSSIAITEKLQNQRDAIQDKRDAQAQKEKDNLDELARKQREFNEQIARENEELFAIKLEQEKAYQDEKIIIEEDAADSADELAQRENERVANSINIKKKQLEFNRQVTIETAKLGIQLGQLITSLAGNNKELAVGGIIIEKASAIAGIIANTASANAKAVDASFATGGQPWVAINTASAALSIAQTIANAAQSIKEINSVKTKRVGGAGFYGGGFTGYGGKYEPAGIVHRGEVVWSKEDVAMAGGPHMANSMRPTYKPYATGGIVGNETRSASVLAISNQSQVVERLVPVLVLEEFQAKEASVTSNQRRAQVV